MIIESGTAPMDNKKQLSVLCDQLITEFSNLCYHFPVYVNPFSFLDVEHTYIEVYINNILDILRKMNCIQEETSATDLFEKHLKKEGGLEEICRRIEDPSSSSRFTESVLLSLLHVLEPLAKESRHYFTFRYFLKVEDKEKYYDQPMKRVYQVMDPTFDFNRLIQAMDQNERELDEYKGLPEEEIKARLRKEWDDRFGAGFMDWLDGQGTS